MIYNMLIIISLAICGETNSKTIELTLLNLISIRGPINSYSTSKFVRDTSNLGTNQINILINSPGRSISDGNIIIEQMKSLNESSVVINCISQFAASMAFIITQACPHRMGISTSILMQHQMSLGVKGEINRINSYLEYIDNLKKSLDLMQANRIGMDMYKFQERVKYEWWIYGNNNIKKNILDEIVIIKCSNDLVNFNL